MPVLVVGADTAAGRAAVEALARAGGEVRAYANAEVAGDDEAALLRALGVKVALGDLDDEAHLETALEQAHTVVHLAIDPLGDADAQLDALATTLSAAIGAGCRRLVWATELAASDPGGNPYLEALAAAEAMLADVPLETVTLRCAVRYAPDDPLTRRLADAEETGLDLSAVHAPLYVGDLAEAVRAADRQRDAREEIALDVELVGPEEVSLGDYLAAVRDALPTAPTRRPLPPAVADWLSRSAPGGPDALGRAGTTMLEGLAGG